MPATRDQSDPRTAAPRRSRTKTRKPKFLSLLRIDRSSSDMPGDRRNHRRKKRPRRQQHRRKLNLLTRRPDTAEDDPADDAKDPLHYDENVNVNLLFNGDDSSPTTLNGLLDEAGAASPVACSEECSVGSRDSVPELRDSRGYGRGDHPNRSSLLVRAAMKSGGRDREEKWVSYSEVVERKQPPPPPPSLPDQETDEVSSCSAAAHSEDGSRARWPWRSSMEAERSSSGGLLLKLDYEDILNSWSHKGSLFINNHEAAPTVPDINNEFLGPDSAINNGLTGLWTVPDQNSDLNSILDEKEGRFRHREASVLRYKEKRQNRLFAKRIRYEVRKLNAEKRPRIKGRFVRRSCEDD